MRSAKSGIGWLLQPGWMGKLYQILKAIWSDYIVLGIASYSGRLLLAAIVLLLVVGVWLGIRKRKVEIPLLAIAAVACSFCISILLGDVQFRRACQCFPLLIGFVVMTAVQWAQKRKNFLKVISLVMIAVMLSGMTLEIHNSFVANYDVRVAEDQALDTLATDLRRFAPISEKPVVFTGVLWAGFPLPVRQYVWEGDWCYSAIHSLTGKNAPIPKTQVIETSLHNFASYAMADVYQPYWIFTRLLEKHGCWVTLADGAQIEAGKALAEKMPAYPRQGYIQETEEFVVVRLS